MSLTPIYISANTEAVDAAPTTKDIALRAVAESTGTPIERIGAIGDSANDLPFLQLPHLGLVGAPLNAQPAVKQFVQTSPHGHLSHKEYIEGFFDFYDRCINQQLKLVFSDRDGVLLWKKTDRELNSLAGLFGKMGTDGRPLVFILTGSSVAQNESLIHVPRIAAAIAGNDRIREQPHLILIENGSIALNVIDGTVDTSLNTAEPELCALLIGPFRRKLLERLKNEVLPRFDLSLSADQKDQNAKIFVPEKLTMVTLNIPHRSQNNVDYRRSLESDKLRSAMVSLMAETADQIKVPYHIIR